jgi:hypothetical protein
MAMGISKIWQSIFLVVWIENGIPATIEELRSQNNLMFDSCTLSKEDPKCRSCSAPRNCEVEMRLVSDGRLLATLETHLVSGKITLPL